MNFLPICLLFSILPHLSESVLSQDEIVKCVTAKKTTWSAGRCLHYNLTFSRLKSSTTSTKLSFRKDQTGVLSHGKDVLTQLPRTFDVKDRWPECRRVVGRIRHQGSCLSSWAAAPASVLSDRICIGTKGKTQVHISTEDILSCCEDCLLDADRQCDGGFAYKAWNYLRKTGGVTGGELNSKEGCQPYSYSHFKGKAASCKDHCTNAKHKKRYHKDKYIPQFVYLLAKGEEQIQKELFDDGPVMASMVLHEDITTYKSGVYQYACGRELGYHAVKILGWGVENGTKYWLAANSWGRHWGDSGLFKIIRGENHCEIEEEIRAAKLGAFNLREYVVGNPDFDDVGGGGDWAGCRGMYLLHFCLVLCLMAIN